MARLFLLFTTLALGVLFMLFNPKGEMGFLFSDMVLTIETWMYFLFEHVIVLILAIVILELEHEYRMSAKVFLCIAIVDTVDYCLTYGDPVFTFMPPWNVVRLVVFGTVVLYEVIWKRLT